MVNRNPSPGFGFCLTASCLTAIINYINYSFINYEQGE